MAKFTAFVKDAKDQVYNLLENDFIKNNFSKDKKYKTASNFKNLNVKEMNILEEVRQFTNGMEDKMSIFTKMSDALNKIVEMDNK